VASVLGSPPVWLNARLVLLRPQGDHLARRPARVAVSLQHQRCPRRSTPQIQCQQYRWAPHDYGLALVAGSSDGSISILQYVESQGWKVVKKDRAHDIGCNTVSWAPYIPAGATLGGADQMRAMPARIASGGCDNKVKVWNVVQEANDVLQQVSVLGEHTDWVRDVAWAPSIGLSHNILATGSQDHQVILWQEDTSTQPPTYTPMDKVQFPACVWRCSWSVNGSILAVSCGDNKVYLLKQNADGTKWEIVSTVDESS